MSSKKFISEADLVFIKKNYTIFKSFADFSCVMENLKSSCMCCQKYISDIDHVYSCIISIIHKLYSHVINTNIDKNLGTKSVKIDRSTMSVNNIWKKNYLYYNRKLHDPYINICSSIDYIKRYHFTLSNSNESLHYVRMKLVSNVIEKSILLINDLGSIYGTEVLKLKYILIKFYINFIKGCQNNDIIQKFLPTMPNLNAICSGILPNESPSDIENKLSPDIENKVSPNSKDELVGNESSGEELSSDGKDELVGEEISGEESSELSSELSYNSYDKRSGNESSEEDSSEELSE